ncbi:MAG TPA: toll/interleukin-1 receptor domain-containing protein, partial [Armatimonadaceae bacterium]|nr:toll/interleukin-1 receptor domain-containing protein [Armatimonadaceae bacterium]
MAHDVFISYSSRDKEAADAIVAALERDGISCWIAPRDIQPGVEWSQAIVEAIRACRLLLLIFTPHSNESPQVLREVERAVSLRVPILPFRVQDAELTASMEYFISVAHWLIATTPPLEAHLPNLLVAVREQMSGGGHVATASDAAGDHHRSSGAAAIVHYGAHTSVSEPAPLSGNLPSVLTEIIGRESETAEVAGLLGTTRLLT